MYRRLVDLPRCPEVSAALAFSTNIGRHSKPSSQGGGHGYTITVNGVSRTVNASPDTPLLYVLTNELDLKGPRFGCGLAQCGSCSVLLDGVEIRSCVTPVSDVARQGGDHARGSARALREAKGLAQAPAMHPLQQAFIDVQAPQCGYCYNGMTIKGSELLAQQPEADRSADPRAHGRPSLPLRHLSARHEGNPARIHQHGGRCPMNAHRPT